MSVGSFVQDNYKSVFNGNKINSSLWRNFGMSSQKYHDGIYGDGGLSSLNGSDAMRMGKFIKTIGSFLNQDTQDAMVSGTGFQPYDTAAKKMRSQDNYNNKMAMKAIMAWMSMFTGGLML